MNQEARIKNTLVIDTSSNKDVRVGLRIHEKEDTVEEELEDHKRQVVLEIIDQLLKKHKLTLNDITHIEVNPGPGSFTGVRVGVTIANALGFSLKIPVNGKPVGEIVEPIYE